jgi:adenine nucleotide transporter 17
VQDILAKEGLKGLYAGVESKLVQSVLTAAILFYAKDRLVHITDRWLASLLAHSIAKKH